MFHCLIPVLLAVVAAPVVAAEQGLSDLPLEKPYSGTVLKVTEHLCDVCKQTEVSVILKTRKGKVEIKLGPKPFLETNGFLLSAGDEITVVGILLPDNRKQAIFANEIGRGGTHLVLRGKFGRPEWLGAHGETCAKCGI
jgi:hypothetical protein